MENRKEGKKSRVEKVGNYMNSDSYLYAPLFAPQRHYLSSKGNRCMDILVNYIV